MSKLALGLDYGTNSVRALLVETETGAEIATAVYEYPSGEAGILLDARDPNLARQNPARGGGVGCLILSATTRGSFTHRSGNASTIWMVRLTKAFASASNKPCHPDFWHLPRISRSVESGGGRKFIRAMLGTACVNFACKPHRLNKCQGGIF